MSNILEASGKSVIGWDVEWPVNWNTNRLKTGGTTMYGTMNSRHTKVNVSAITMHITTLKEMLLYESKTIYLLQSPGKIVLLMHDVAYRDGGNLNSENSAEDELITFLSLAKESGYIFSTLDRYLQD